MNCTTCDDKVCRKQQTSCSREIFDKQKVISHYKETTNSKVLKAILKK